MEDQASLSSYDKTNTEDDLTYVRLQDEDNIPDEVEYYNTRRCGVLRLKFRRWREKRRRQHNIIESRMRLRESIRAIESKMTETIRRIERSREIAREVMTKATLKDKTSQKTARLQASPHVTVALRRLEYLEQLSKICGVLIQLELNIERAQTCAAVHGIMNQASRETDRLLDRIKIDDIEKLIGEIAVQHDDLSEAERALSVRYIDDDELDDQVEQELANLMLWDPTDVMMSMTSHKKTADKAYRNNNGVISESTNVPQIANVDVFVVEDTADSDKQVEFA